MTTLAVNREKANAAAMVSGEFALTAEDFRDIARILYDASGIHLEEAKASLVYSRLAKRIRHLGLTSFEAYRARLRGPQAAEERTALLSALTTNVTRFFREPHHFDDLRRIVREELGPRARAGERVRLWSAGCSLGHEPYSMAMVILSELPEAPRLDLRILATDIDPSVVEKARAGQYPLQDVEPIPADLAERWLRWGPDQAVIESEPRALLSFGVLNLNGPWPVKGPFDVIFCRNVAIYFDDTTQARLWTRFASALAPDGRLFIGHSERAEVSDLRSAGLTVYRRSEA